MSQETNEATYTGYARVAVVRSAAGWTVSGVDVSNAGAVTFGNNVGADPQDVTHFGIGFAESGAGRLLISKALTDGPKEIGVGKVASFVAGGLSVSFSGDGISDWLTDLLELIFCNTDAPNIGDATGLRGSSVAGSLYVSLHTADPQA
jgi:hypothetical protein